jgi:putative addiction module component (TIGR02574 family)
VSSQEDIVSPTFASLGLDKLSREERLALVQELWDSIAADNPRSLLTDAQRAELRRRVAEDDANPDDVIPWEQVKAEGRARMQS